MGKLEGKVAIVTGAARGMGAAEAARLVAEGAAVLLADVRDEEGRQCANALGSRALYMHLDVRSEEGWAAAVDAAVRRFGRLDILVNNAGVLHMAPITQMSLDDFRFVHDVNVVGSFLGMRTAIPKMLAGGGGSIINIASLNGVFGAAGLSGYTATKHAVIGMTRAVAMELGPSSVRVNAVCPGGIDTPMAARTNEIAGFDAISSMTKKIPLRRMGRADEMARMIVFLASDDSSYCTGAVFMVDGGISAGFDLS